VACGIRCRSRLFSAARFFRGRPSRGAAAGLIAGVGAGAGARGTPRSRAFSCSSPATCCRRSLFCSVRAATSVCSVFMFFQRPTGHLVFSVVTGLGGGLCYFASLVYYFLAMERLGVGLASATIRMSVALPVAAALLIWHESLRPPQIAGLLLVAAALPLLGGGNQVSVRSGLGVLFGLLLPLFVINGTGQLANRVFTGGAPAANAGTIPGRDGRVRGAVIGAAGHRQKPPGDRRIV